MSKSETLRLAIEKDEKDWQDLMPMLQQENPRCAKTLDKLYARRRKYFEASETYEKQQRRLFAFIALMRVIAIERKIGKIIKNTLINI